MPASASTSTSPPGPATFFSVCVAEILFLVAALSGGVSQDLDPPSKMATVFTQAASTLKLNLHAPKPASRFDDLSFDPMDASPLPARGLAAAGCVQAMPPRRSNSSARAPLVCASLTSEATLHRRGRAPPRRGTKVILTDLRKHDDLNGEVGFIVFKPDDRFDGRPVPRPPARPPGHRLRQGIKPARRHVRTLRRAPLHPRARRSVTLRSAPRAARAGASTTTRCSRSSTASSRSSD